MLADKSLNYKFISQRKYPLMALITTEINLVEGNLIVNAPGMIPLAKHSHTHSLTHSQGMPTLVIKLPGKLAGNHGIVFNATDAAEANVIQCDIWGDICDGIEMSESISSWFSKYLNNDNIKCIRMAPSFQRKLDTKYDSHDNHTVFSDGFPYLLTSTARLPPTYHKNILSNLLHYLLLYSIADLQSKMPSSVPISTENFRPNIVVAGCAAYAEDNWSNITIKSPTDSIHLQVVKPCARCKIPSIDPLTGVMDANNTVTKVLKTYRTGKHLGYSNSKWEGEVFFGQNVVSSGTTKNYMRRLAVGDMVYLT